MTAREQIIAAGFEHFEQFPEGYKQKLVDLFEAGRIYEREACARIAIEQNYGDLTTIASRIYKAIRERGTK